MAHIGKKDIEPGESVVEDNETCIVVEVEQGQNYDEIVGNIQKFVEEKVQKKKKVKNSKDKADNQRLSKIIINLCEKGGKMETAPSEGEVEEQEEVVVETTEAFSDDSLNAEIDYEDDDEEEEVENYSDEEVEDEPLSDVEYEHYALDGTVAVATQTTRYKRKPQGTLKKATNAKKLKKEVKDENELDKQYEEVSVPVKRGRKKKEKPQKEKKVKKEEQSFKNPLDYYVDSVDCPYCPNRYSGKNAFYEHMEMKHSGQYTLICKTCCVPFLSEECFALHSAECDHPHPRIHTCHFCNDESCFLAKWRLEEHLKEAHNGMLPFSCKICNQKLVSRYDQIEHASTHKEDGLQCKHCPNSNRKFKSLLHYDCHLTSKHSTAPNTCFICQLHLSNFSLLEHVRSHCQADLQVCEHCGNTYSGKYAIRTHRSICKARPDGGSKRTYSMQTMYICDQCNTSFLGGRKLREHMSRVHGVGQTMTCRY